MAQYRTVTEFLTKIRGEYNQAREKYTALHDQLKDVNDRWSAELTRGWSDIKQREADRERYDNIKADLNRQISELINNTNAAFDRIKSECDDVFAIYDRATADKVDLATVELLRSGILRDDEIEALANDFDGNCAMLRIIGEYAFNKGTKEDNKKLRQFGALLKNYRFQYREHIDALVYWSKMALREDRGLADGIARVYDEKADELFKNAEGIFVEVKAE